MNKRFPCITVIIPVYNAERFLLTAFRSAYDQDEVSEIILVEDNSPDNSLKLCKEIAFEFKDKVRLTTHSDGHNHGAGASRNLGITLATGDYIAFLDADDYYLPNRFQKDIEILSNCSDIDGVYNAMGTHVYDASESGRIETDMVTLNYKISPDKLFEEMGPIGKAGFFSTNTITVRRDTFDKVGYFDNTLELSQDTHMWLKMAAKLRLVAGNIEKPVAVRGVHKKNRIKDKEKLYHYRPLMFESLLKWSISENVSIMRRKKLLDKFIEHSIINIQSKHKEISIYNNLSVSFKSIKVKLYASCHYPRLFFM